jgi:hypothetical protein
MRPKKTLKVRLAILFATVMARCFKQYWIVGYGGQCDSCQAPYRRLVFRVVGNTIDRETEFVVVPRIVECCKVCHRPIVALRVYKSMDVTREFNQIKKEQK